MIYALYIIKVFLIWHKNRHKFTIDVTLNTTPSSFCPHPLYIYPINICGAP